MLLSVLQYRCLDLAIYTDLFNLITGAGNGTVTYDFLQILKKFFEINNSLLRRFDTIAVRIVLRNFS